MSEPNEPNCASCAAKDAEIAKLREQLAAARKDSTNSSKPPSSDIVKPETRPPLPEGQEKRKIGAQPGHKANFRDLFDDLQINQVVPHTLSDCPHCGGELRRNGDRVHLFQQVDVALPNLTVTEHQCPDYWCEACRRSCKAELPEAVKRGGMAGPMLTTLVAYLKGCCHASFSTIRLFLRDVCGLKIARGTLAKIIDRVSSSLADSYGELERLLPEQRRLNIDETGHKENGDLLWTWCLKADLFTLFKIAPSRGSAVLLDVLGREFDGVIGCDYFSAYRKFMRLVGVEVQFCLAHLIRDVKFLCELPDRPTMAYGIVLKQELKKLFGVIHRREGMSEAAFCRELKACKASMMEVAKQAPATPPAQAMAKRFAKHGESYFTFITTPGMEPTNNAAERAIRFVVLDRHVTQGTRGETGRRWCERIWTVLATCRQRGISAFAFLREAVENWLDGKESPSLLDGAFAPA